MMTLRIIGDQAAGKSLTLRALQKLHPHGSLMLAVPQGRLTDVGNMIDRTGQKPTVVMLDIECELSPAAQQKLIAVCESRGVQQLFLAYQG